MAFMRSTLAYALFWFNFIITGLILGFVLLYSNTNNNLNVILYVDLGIIFFLFLFLISFCVGGNECCTSDREVNAGFAIGSWYGACICCDNCCSCVRNGECICQCLSGMDCKGNDGEGLFYLLVFLLVFLLFYYLFKKCGKHGLRISFLVIISIAYCVMAYFAIESRNGTLDIFLILVIVFSLLTSIINLLGIILPNRFNILSYQYVESSYSNDDKNLNDMISLTQPVSADFAPQNLAEASSEEPIVPIYNGPNQTNNYNPPKTIYQQYNIYQDVPSTNNNDIDATAPTEQYPSSQ